MLTGSRMTEILTLPWEDIDLKTAELRLPVFKIIGRAVPLAPSAVRLLKSLPRDEDNPWVPAADSVFLVPDNTAPIPLTLRVPTFRPRTPPTTWPLFCAVFTHVALRSPGWTTVRDVAAPSLLEWERELSSWNAPLDPVFRRSLLRETGGAFLDGLLSGIKRMTA